VPPPAVPGPAPRDPIRSDTDLPRVRRLVRAHARALGLGLVRETKLVTAASELARNTLVHGGGGEMELAVVTRDGAAAIRLRFIDRGPGIPDLDRALADGYTTGGGLGGGLGGARRLVSEFTVEPTPGGGTTVTVVTWADAPPP
jgi:serine/threonine-protein kinase RsbT